MISEVVVVASTLTMLIQDLIVSNCIVTCVHPLSVCVTDFMD